MNIVTFGEIMLRLTPPEYHTIESTNSFQANYGGGEANVAVSLSRFGHNSIFVSKLPNNQLGDSAIRYLNSHNVNTKHINRGGSNIGIYFLEPGFGGRNSKVLYNRKYASITSVEKQDFNFDDIFKNADWFHFSGITLSLGEKVRKLLFKMLEIARAAKIPISLDVNYRKTLWPIEEAQTYYQKVLPYIDILFANTFDSEKLFGIKRDLTISKSKQETKLLLDLIDNSNIKKIFGTKRKIHNANENELSAYCYMKNKVIETDSTKFNIYDRIGGGDAFAAGIINGMLKKPLKLKEILEFGLATSILKHTLWGDAFMLSENDVYQYIKDNKTAINR